MRKVVILTLIIILAALLLIGGDFLSSMSNSEDHRLTLNSTNVKFQEISDSVDSLETMSWGEPMLDFFQEIEAEIEAGLEHDLINLKERKELLDDLNLTYVPILNEATKTFFRGPCTDRVLLGKLNSELRRYREEMADKRYVEEASEMRSATSAVYATIGYRDKYSGLRKGLDQQVLTYVSGPFLEETSISLQERLRLNSTLPYLSGCELVLNSIRSNYERLNEHHRKYVADRLAQYFSAGDYIPDMHLALIETVNAYAQRKYNRSTKNKALALQDKLDQFFIDSRKNNNQ